jgi:hypothetical protein
LIAGDTQGNEALIRVAVVTWKSWASGKSRKNSTAERENTSSSSWIERSKSPPWIVGRSIFRDDGSIRSPPTLRVANARSRLLIRSRRPSGNSRSPL